MFPRLRSIPNAAIFDFPSEAPPPPSSKRSLMRLSIGKQAKPLPLAALALSKLDRPTLAALSVLPLARTPIDWSEPALFDF